MSVLNRCILSIMNYRFDVRTYILQEQMRHDVRAVKVHHLRTSLPT